MSRNPFSDEWAKTCREMPEKCRELYSCKQGSDIWFGAAHLALALKEHCEMLRKLMTQKTAGQRADKPSDISFAELDTVMNVIVIEAMCLYLSGDLDKLEGEER